MDIVYSSPVIEFVTVGAEYCAFLEQSEGREKDVLVDKLLKLLPLLYLKAQLLPRVEGSGTYNDDSFVTEADYEWLRNILTTIMGEDDTYEDLVYDEQMETDESHWRSVGEQLADIYQPVRDFIETFKCGVEELINESLWTLNDNFELYLGADIVDVMRHLHRVKYTVR